MRASRACISFILLLLFTTAASADPLQDILERPEMKSSKGKDNTATLLQYVNPESNYGQLVLETTGYSALETWLGSAPKGYKVLKTRVQRKHALIDFLQIYRHNKSGFEMHVKVFVPYPRSQNAAEVGLVKELSSLEPPSLPVDSVEDKEIGGLPGKIFFRRDRGISLLIKLPRQSVISFVCLNPDSLRPMLDLANQLDLQGLKEKLES